MKALLKRQPLAECIRRVRIFFDEQSRPSWLTSYDLASFVQHLDKFAAPTAARNASRGLTAQQIMEQARADSASASRRTRTTSATAGARRRTLTAVAVNVRPENGRATWGPPESRRETVGRCDALQGS